MESTGESDLEFISPSVQDMLKNDGESLQFDTDISDLADFITKSESEIPLDIIQSSGIDSPPQNLCDVIHQLHGDQQHQDQQQKVQIQQKPPQVGDRERSQMSNGGYQQNIDYRRLQQPNTTSLPIQQRRDQFHHQGCLPESPPDSGSEPYSPPQDGKMMGRFALPALNQREPTHKELSRGQMPVTSPNYEQSRVPQQTGFVNRINGDVVRMLPAGMSCANGEMQYNVMGNHTMGTNFNEHDNGGYLLANGIKSMSSLSPGSSSDGSVRAVPVSYNHGAPAKKRKHSESPNNSVEQLNVAMLTQKYRHMVQQQSIKQEPGMLPSPTVGERRADYFNDAYEMTETGSIPLRMAIPGHVIAGGARLNETLHHDTLQERPANNVSPSHYSDNGSAYQVIKWSPFVRDTWCLLCDQTGKELQPVSYRVDADKGFNFAVSDDTFVCQKKNHFQVTVHIGVVGHPCYIKTEEGLKAIDAFYINLYGVKFESQNQTIAIEQSQSDRSKKAFHPVKVDLPGDQVTKVTIGRLHFSETTTNNMRKKGRPNPDQRYFMAIVALHAQSGGKSYAVCAAGTEKIIVRASNPGQFDQDDIQWQRSQIPDAIFHQGRVGINYDHPDEALVVHGNIKLTGHIMQPSDLRAKQAIEEVDSRDQLRNVQNVRICRYRYSPEYAMYAGIDSNREETGVIAQEFAGILPEAVRDTGEVKLANGETINNFLVVDKDRLYMENVGAVKELCKLTGNFEERIDELERLNKRLTQLRKYDSIRSKTSVISGMTGSTPSVSRQGSTRNPEKPHSNRRSGATTRGSRTAKPPPAPIPARQGCMGHRCVQAMVISLVIVMAFSVIAMATLYILELNSHKSHGQTDSAGSTEESTLASGNTSDDNFVATTPSFRTTTSSIATHTTTSTAAVTGAPIDYCPLVDPDCVPDAEFCCTSEPAGTPIDRTYCFRDLYIDPISASEKFIPKSSTRRVTATPSTGRKIPKPRDAIWYKGNRPSFPGHHSHEINRAEEKIEYEPYVHYSDEEPPIIPEVESGKSVDGLTPRIPEARFSDPGEEGSDDGEVPMPPEVHKINKRQIMEEGQLAPAVLSIKLIEPNVTLQGDMADKNPYTNCETHLSNYTYNIPVSPHTPPSGPVTLQFNMVNSATVILCSTTTKSACPDSNLEQGTGVRQYQTEKGHKANFQIYFTYYVVADYTFRVTTSSQEASAICDASNEDAGTLYAEYGFHFYRTCTTLLPSMDEMDDSLPDYQM